MIFFFLVRRATEEMEWRKQQEQIRLEQLDLERREREWEEQRLLEQIRYDQSQSKKGITNHSEL